MGRVKRKLMDAETINELIENQLPFVTINNRIFDDLYEQDKIFYKCPDKNDKLVERETKFTDLDMVVFVLLRFLDVNKLTLTKAEIAKYIGCSQKQLKTSLEKLGWIEAKCNAKYSRIDFKIHIEEGRKVFLVNEKEYEGFDYKTKKKMKMTEWYVNFIPDHKVVKEEGEENIKPHSFFMVTIDDFNLLTSGRLSRSEFVTYLFMLRINNHFAEEDNRFYISTSKMADRLGVRLHDTMEKYIQKICSIELDNGFMPLPLITIERPKNYEQMIKARKEPSCRYVPTANLARTDELKTNKVEMDSDKVEVDLDFDEIEEMSSNKLESNSNKTEMSFDKLEVSLNSLEKDFYRQEMSSNKLEATLNKLEMNKRKMELNDIF